MGVRIMLENKVILITGASRGIGRAAAIECGKRGAHVIVNYNEHRRSAEEVAVIINKRRGERPGD